MNLKTLRQVLYQWGPAVLLMAAIFAFSAMPAEQVARAAAPILGERESKTAPETGAVEVDWYKVGHAVGYGLLGMALHRGFAMAGRAGLLPPVAVSALYACTDELHQMLVPGRSGAPGDVALDTAAALVCVILFRALRKRA